jgi:hypothetical protein
MPQVEHDVYFGAAYLIIQENLGLPPRCTTRERLAEIRRDLDQVYSWASTQPQFVRAGYERAGAHYFHDCTVAVENNERAARLHTLHNSIPRPLTFAPKPQESAQERDNDDGT